MARPTLTVTLDKADRRDLKRIRSLHDRKQADAMRVILLKADGLDNQEIAHLLQMGRNRVGQILQRYHTGGIEAVWQSGQHKGSAPRLTPEQQAALKGRFARPASQARVTAVLRGICAVIQAMTRVIHRTPVAHTRLEHRLSSYEKATILPVRY